MLSWCFAREQFHICIHHDPDQFIEVHFWFPAESLFCLGSISDQQISLSRPFVTRVVFHVFFPIKIDVGEGSFGKLAHRVRLTGRDHEILAAVLLQNRPHRPNILRRVAPVAFRLQIAEK